jgi:hypothetical protein
MSAARFLLVAGGVAFVFWAMMRAYQVYGLLDLVVFSGVWAVGIFLTFLAVIGVIGVPKDG